MSLWFHDPTMEELYESAFGITDDVSWYVFRDDANRQTGGSWEAGYEAWCIDNHNYVPIRLHNLAENNQWGYPPGPPCVRQSIEGKGLPPLKQWQIAYLNACVPYEAVVAATAVLNDLKTKLPPLPEK